MLSLYCSISFYIMNTIYVKFIKIYKYILIYQINVFQITCHAQLQGEAIFVRTGEGLKKISSFQLHFYGVKVESPTQTIRVEQSQSDRSKKPFHPVT